MPGERTQQGKPRLLSSSEPTWQKERTESSMLLTCVCNNAGKYVHMHNKLMEKTFICVCVSVCVHTCMFKCMMSSMFIDQMRSQDGAGASEALCGTRNECWELQLNPLEEKRAFLISEP